MAADGPSTSRNSALIPPDEAIAIARARAESNGWALIEPLSVLLRRPWRGKGGTYEIVTNPAIRGGNSRFRIDAITGEIVDEGHISH